ncbi:MAG: class IV adenylate cyclase [Thermodesulfobacteriota bacterium]
MINIEIKAKCSNHEIIRNKLKQRNAYYKGIDHQVDTYFKVNSGRLKLREGDIEYGLIFYDREEKKGPKQSNIIICKPDRNSLIKEILTQALGILVVVDKKREIYFIDNVKFHLDNVKSLGTFVEIEAIDNDVKIEKNN